MDGWMCVLKSYIYMRVCVCLFIYSYVFFSSLTGCGWSSGDRIGVGSWLRERDRGRESKVKRQALETLPHALFLARSVLASCCIGSEVAQASDTTAIYRLVEDMSEDPHCKLFHQDQCVDIEETPPDPTSTLFELQYTRNMMIQA